MNYYYFWLSSLPQFGSLLFFGLLLQFVCLLSLGVYLFYNMGKMFLEHIKNNDWSTSLAFFVTLLMIFVSIGTIGFGCILFTELLD